MEQVTTRPAQSSEGDASLVTLLAHTDTLVVAANRTRVGGRISNQSGATIWLKLGKAAAAEKAGIPLAAGTYFDLAGYNGEVRGISAAEAKEGLSVVELVTGEPVLSGEDEEFTPEGPTLESVFAAPGFSAKPRVIPGGTTFP